ncbi:hypothetical protein ACLFMI_05960 [Pseudonocardia nantongensis]|uniref:hypothetical protein n=1 Tax=Pseudonocardia nantongensis TaxID=1181885 RepID=UPI003978F5C3
MTDSSRTTVLGLIADPGLPTKIADRLTRELPSELERHGDGQWDVQICDEPIFLDEQGALPMIEIGRRACTRQSTDAVVLITDLPRRAGSDPVVADAGTADRVGLVSIPALGALDQYRRCRDTIVRLVTRHLFPAEDRASVGEQAPAGSAGSLTRVDSDQGTTDPNSDEDTGSAGVEDEVDVRLALTGTRGRLRLLTGMVRANRPWRLVPSLAPAIAAAAAGAAFGIFYSNIWQLATALGPVRHVLVMLIALVGMTTWLISNNGLWESRQSRSLREEMVLSNASTVLTVACGVVIMFALLFALALIAAALVIPPDYLGSTLMQSPGVSDYVMIAWLSTSMGTVAGALGSGFADEDAVRQAAYSRREQERRTRLDQQEADASDSSQE